MLARMGQGTNNLTFTAPQPPKPSQPPLPVVTEVNGSWSFADQDWMIVNPKGQRIFLTTGERAFLVTLLNAPDQRASHADLIAAVCSAYHALPEANRRQGRLSVLVSRLRAKCIQHNIDLPLKSVHRWGYMFSGRVQL